jgi:HK97 family phage prohead protease
MDKNYTDAKVEKASSKDVDFMAIASTGAVDRHGESVSVEGWNVKEFKKNPVLLWAHDHTQPAVGHATKIWVEGKGKSAKLMIEGVINDATELSRSVKQLVKDGVIKTMSVGFRALEMEGNTFTDQELLEVSFVNVPANSQAMITAYKSLSSKGFSDEAIKQVGVATDFSREIIELRKELAELKVKTLVKVESPTASYGRSVFETRQKNLKAIARATDELLVGKTMPTEKRDKILKFIKKANEQLIVDNKGVINNGKN